MSLHNVGDTVLHIVSTYTYYSATIVQKLANDHYKIAYDSYGTGVVNEDAIYNESRRTVDEVESYADVDDDVMDIEMKMEMEEEEEAEENKEYEVEGIVDRQTKTIEGNEVVEFLIKWKGYDASENTWEPYDELQKNELVLEDINDWMLKQQPIKIEDTSDVTPIKIYDTSDDQLLKDIKKEDSDSWYC
jgi:hypothetical protein